MKSSTEPSGHKYVGVTKCRDTFMSAKFCVISTAGHPVMSQISDVYRVNDYHNLNAVLLR